ncbi:MAG: hypothetical protein LQ339_006520 [Xanthoria mediterranea]|nr:MAG: hypothetical protein LQ339_006520 [Xanthoria mediterranea]
MTKRKRQQGYYTKRMKSVQEGSNEEVLLADIRSLLQRSKIDDAGVTSNNESSATDSEAPFERFSQVEVKIAALSSIGDGLGFSSSKSDHVFVVPFTLPGDVVEARVVTQFANDHYTLTDFVSILKPSPQRNDDLVRCPYFAKCSGCQFQMLSYEDQLAHKKSIVEKAYRNFSNLPIEMIPLVGDTIGSPLQYGYRTKLTPHFDGPPGSRLRRGRKDGSEQPGFEQVPPIGFMVKGTRKTMDIEDCPIATDAVREGLKQERNRVAEEISKYKRGATILLRETTTKAPTQPQDPPATTDDPQSISNETDSSNQPRQAQQTNPSPTCTTTTKTYITDQNATATEHIGPYTFLNPAGAFFQNNNSILETFTSYIRSHILPASPSTASTLTLTNTRKPPKPIKHLIDTYSGSGLFSITLSPLFTTTLGIDISSTSIASASLNAAQNAIPNATFTTGDAADIFAEAKTRYGDGDGADECVVVIDPPRKGCDEGFLRQLLGFRPKRVVYVSCNVHTQARDVGVLVRGGREGWGLEREEGKAGGDVGTTEKEVERGGEVDGGKVDGDGSGAGNGKGMPRVRYRIESLRGFDFFPQTGHVEGVAILQRVDDDEGNE